MEQIVLNDEIIKDCVYAGMKPSEIANLYQVTTKEVIVRIAVMMMKMTKEKANQC